jgi:hypothetical protein
METSPALPPLPLKFKPSGDRTLEDEFSGWFSGAAIRYFDAQGRILVHIPLQVPEIAKDGSFTLPALVANWASESGTAVTAKLVNRVGESLGIEGPVSGPDGKPLKVTKGQIVEFVWAAPGEGPRGSPKSPRAPSPLPLDAVLRLDGALLQAFNERSRIVAQVPMHNRQPGENPPRDGAVWITKDTACIAVPSHLAKHGPLEIDLVQPQGSRLIATATVAPTGARPPLVLELPLTDADDVLEIVPKLLRAEHQRQQQERREQRAADLDSLREQVQAMAARLAELEGAD